MQANMYYKMLISWTSQKVKETYSTRNKFDFKHGTTTWLSVNLIKFKIVLLDSELQHTLWIVHTGIKHFFFKRFIEASDYSSVTSLFNKIIFVRFEPLGMLSYISNELKNSDAIEDISHVWMF